jgi:hypothetical protein
MKKLRFGVPRTYITFFLAVKMQNENEFVTKVSASSFISKWASGLFRGLQSNKIFFEFVG